MEIFVFDHDSTSLSEDDWSPGTLETSVLKAHNQLWTISACRSLTEIDAVKELQSKHGIIICHIEDENNWKDLTIQSLPSTCLIRTSSVGRPNSHFMTEKGAVVLYLRPSHDDLYDEWNIILTELVKNGVPMAIADYRVPTNLEKYFGKGYKPTNLMTLSIMCQWYLATMNPKILDLSNEIIASGIHTAVRGRVTSKEWWTKPFISKSTPPKFLLDTQNIEKEWPSVDSNKQREDVLKLVENLESCWRDPQSSFQDEFLPIVANAYMALQVRL